MHGDLYSILSTNRDSCCQKGAIAWKYSKANCQKLAIFIVKRVPQIWSIHSELFKFCNSHRRKGAIGWGFRLKFQAFLSQRVQKDHNDGDFGVKLVKSIIFILRRDFFFFNFTAIGADFITMCEKSLRGRGYFGMKRVKSFGLESSEGHHPIEIFTVLWAYFIKMGPKKHDIICDMPIYSFFFKKGLYYIGVL